MHNAALRSTFTGVLKIAHISDIHYRPLSRHAEYRQVFEKFAESCWESSVDAIVVTGDIYHCKTTGISAEYIDELSWWVRTLASVAPLHLTLGNHDFNMSNKGRQDAVSPIVSSLRNDSTIENPVKLYKDSGVYPLSQDVNLCVYSIFDEDRWGLVAPVAGKKNVAVYHGPVDSAVTETGWKMSSSVSVDMFKDYDVCLLGDIHKQQFLSCRTVGGELTPWIGYPGSAVQQNYAEDIDHGYLLWDIRANGHRVDFIKLPNPKPFVTVGWTPGIADISVPEGSRVRVKHTGPLSQLDTKLATQHFRDKCRASEVTFSQDSAGLTSHIAATAARARHDFHDVTTLMDLLRRHDVAHSMTEPDWADVQQAVSHYVSKMVPDESAASRGVKWSLKDLRFDNIMGYGDGSHIRFGDLGGLVGVFGPNRSGKSSAIAALTYCLFNSSDRGPLKNLQFINVRKPHAYARAVLTVNQEDYVVERQTVRVPGKKEETGSTSVNLFKIVDGEAVDMNGEQRSDTDKLIRGLIGSVEDFMMTSMSTQGDIDRFIREGSSHRKQVLTRFMDLDFMDQLFDLAKADVTSLKAEAKAATPASQDDPQKIEEQKRAVQASVDSLNILRDSRRVAAQAARASLESLGADAAKVSSRREKESKLAALRSSLASLESEKAQLASSILEAETSAAASEAVASSCDPSAVAAALERVIAAKEVVSAREREKTAAVTKESAARSSVRVLQEVPCDNAFPTCKFIRSAVADSSALPGMERDTAIATAALEEATAALASLNEAVYRAESKKYEEARSSVEVYRKKSAVLGRQLLEVESKAAHVAASVESIVEAIAELPASLPAGYDDALVTVRSREEELRSVEAELLSASRQLGVLDEKLDKSREASDRLVGVLRRLKVHEFISQAFSKKGVPAAVLSERLPVINQEISSILAGVVDFGIELECEPGSSSLEVYINYGDSRRAIELCSGMEKMVASLAIRIALTNLTTVPKSDIMVIDEGFGVLDEINADAVKKILVAAKKYFKSIVIISHVPAIKDVADTVLEVRRNEKDSKITH